MKFCRKKETDRTFACEQLVTKVARESFRENMSHFLVLPEFSWCKKFQRTHVAFET